MKQIKNMKYEEFQESKRDKLLGRVLTPEGIFQVQDL